MSSVKQVCHLVCHCLLLFGRRRAPRSTGCRATATGTADTSRAFRPGSGLRPTPYGTPFILHNYNLHSFGFSGFIQRAVRTRVQVLTGDMVFNMYALGLKPQRLVQAANVQKGAMCFFHLQSTTGSIPFAHVTTEVRSPVRELRRDTAHTELHTRHSTDTCGLWEMKLHSACLSLHSTRHSFLFLQVLLAKAEPESLSDPPYRSHGMPHVQCLNGLPPARTLY